MYIPILYAEDDENDAFFMTRALNDAGIENHLEIVATGQEAIDYLTGAGQFGDRGAHPIPFLVLLDLKLPAHSGLEVLEWIRGQSRFRDVRVVVLASSREDPNIPKALGLGANAYLLKPPTAQALRDLLRILEPQAFHGRQTALSSSSR